MHDDDPGDVVHDTFAAAVFGDHPLGQPVLGTVDSIAAIAPDAVRGYYLDRYLPPALVVAAAGHLDHDRVVRLVEQAFATTGRLDGVTAPLPVRGTGPGEGPRFVGRVQVTRRPTEQANLVLGTLGLSRRDERRFALGVLNNALGGGMSSRLFQEVREKRGLAYSVYSYLSRYADSGLFGIYAGCQPARVDEVLAICRDQLGAVVEAGITDEELDRGKGQLKGSYVLGLEDSGSRMSRIGKSELVYGELLGVDEILRRIDAVSPDDVRTVAREVLSGPLTLGVVGPFDPDRDFRSAVA